MRKILIGVLSVAGLLAAALALASGPAAAVKNVITITSDTEAGVYTVTWSTKGGCDPGLGASGASGSVTLTVVDATPNDDTENVGTAEQTGVVIDTICTYEWEAVLVQADGSRCKVADITIEGNAETLEVGACNSVEKVTFTVVGYTTPATGGDPAVPPTAAVTGAVKNTTFTVTAVEKVPTGAKADPECATVSGDTKLSDAGGNQVELTLVDATFNARNCTYTVTAALPAGFAAGAKGSNSAVVVMNGPPNPSDSDPANNRATVDESPGTPSTTALNATLEVTVAAPTVYLVQNVTGDAGGVSVEYEYSVDCGAPGLPGPLAARTDAGGGIVITPATAVVELRLGRYNVSAGIGDNTAEGTKASALNEDAEACQASVTVSGVPAGCSVKHNSPVDLVGADDPVIVEFTIDCTSSAAESAEASEPAAGGDMVEIDEPADASDVGDGADMSDVGDGADTGTDDTDGDMQEIDDGGSVGPPRDSATG